MNNVKFDFKIGRSPTRIYGRVHGLRLRLLEEGYYNFPRKRTFFGTASNSTNFAHIHFFSPIIYGNEHGLYYGISSYGDKFPSATTDGSDSSVAKVSCGGMFRYYFSYTGIQILSISSTCDKTFTENDDDDFDSFIATIKLAIVSPITPNLYMDSSNIIVESINIYCSQYVYIYPNKFYKYNSTNSTDVVFIVANGRNEYSFQVSIAAQDNDSSTVIKGIQNEDKTLSTFLIATSKHLDSIDYLTGSENYNLQLLFIGLNVTYFQISQNEIIEYCEVMLSNPNYNTCYKCGEGFYLENGICIEENGLCRKRINSECVSCDEGYFLIDGDCVSASIIIYGCIELGNDYRCHKCQEDYILNDGDCYKKEEDCLKYGNNICLKCQFGYQLINNKCEQCDDERCYYEDYQCIECSDGFTLDGSSCIPKEENMNGINEIIYCEDGYYIENGTCNECVNSSNCESKSKISCLEGYYNENNTCISKTCEIKDENGKCGIEIKNCKDNLIVNGRCVECENEYYPNINGECITSQIDNCIYQNSKGCQRCSDGYYLDSNLQCQECSNECVTCSKSSNYCLSCENEMYLLDYKCVEIADLKEMCQVLFLDGSGCAICKEGYYKEEKRCKPCLTTCETCNRNTTCLECKDGYFMKNGGQCKSINETEVCAVEIDKQTGCNRCKDGYYKIDNECYKCQTPCLSCSNEKECNTCIDEYVIDNKQCVSYHQISHCVDTKESKCSECSFWYQTSSDGTYCESHAVWWMIVLIVLVILLIIVLVVIGIYCFTNYLISTITRKRLEKKLGIFAINEKRVELLSVGQGLLVSTKTINFGKGKNIPVNKPVEESLFAANKGKELLEIKLTTKEKVDKYSIKSEPQVVVLKQNQVIEMKIIFNLMCTCEVESSFLILCKKKKKKKFMKEIRFDAVGEISTRLDYDEIKEDKKIGEGSFGIVYKGTFRGNKVAIKKLKKMNHNKMKEFKDEVAMLDKFRSEYIIHFYGACFILNKICMVTEFAQFGSLNNLKKKQNETYITGKLRPKILFDAAKGIQYLHSNGILHRDIKPDNILVTSLSLEDPVNAKLTDFGTSRNINMLMTNMTFTNGVGTPAFMAPEILKKEKYKMAADVYSFAITMFEIFGWCECYPQSIYEFTWDIAEFVNEGKRRPKPENMTNVQYQLIEQCWKQDPRERLMIENIVENLQQFLI